jgi:hypothetical protein
MCRSTVGEEYFKNLVTKFKKRIYRSRTSTRSYNRNLKQIKYLAKYSGIYGISIIVNEEKRTVKVRKIKREEEHRSVLVWPYEWFHGGVIGSGDEEASIFIDDDSEYPDDVSSSESFCD